MTASASEIAILHPGEVDNSVHPYGHVFGPSVFAMDNNIDAIFVTDNKHRHKLSVLVKL